MKLRGKAVTIITMMMLLPVSIVLAQDAEDDMGETPAVKTEKSLFSYDAPVVKKTEEKHWFFNLAGIYIRKVGNTDTLTANLRTDINYNNNISELEISYKTFYGETKGQVNENRGIGVVKYDHYIFQRIELFVFTQSEYSEAAKLNYRNNSGLGAKFVFFKNYFWRMDVSGAPVYQYEDYKDREETNTYRWSFRYRLKLTPFKDVSANFVTFYIPKMDDFEQYRFNIDTNLTVKILTNLSLKIGYVHQFNKNALPGTRRYDDTSYVQIGVHI